MNWTHQVDLPPVEGKMYSGIIEVDEEGDYDVDWGDIEPEHVYADRPWRQRGLCIQCYCDD